MPFRELKKGDKFRLYESDTGEMVYDNKQNSLFTADSDAYLNEDKIFTKGLNQKDTTLQSCVWMISILYFLKSVKIHKK